MNGQQQDKPLQIVIVSGQEEKAGQLLCIQEERDAPNDLSTLRIATIGIVQDESRTAIQWGYPAVVFEEFRGMLHIHVGAKALPTYSDVRQDIKAMRNLPDSSPHEKDSMPASEAALSEKFVAKAGSDGDEIKRWVEGTTTGVKASGFMNGCAIQNPIVAAKVIDSFMHEACMHFPSRDVRATLFAIAAQNGNPDVILIYGHGGPQDIKAPMGGYDHITGENFAQALKDASLSPSMVIFVACESHEVARSAHAWWTENCTTPCAFLGSATERPSFEIRDGSLLVARFLYNVVTNLVRLALGCERSVMKFSLPNENSEGAAIIFNDERMHRKKLMDLYWYVLRDTKDVSSDDWYYSGAYENTEKGAEHILKVLHSPTNDVWRGMIEVFLLLNQTE